MLIVTKYNKSVKLVFIIIVINRSNLKLRLDNVVVNLRIRYKKILYNNKLKIEYINKVNKLIIIEKRVLSLIKLDVIIFIKNNLYVFNDIDYIAIHFLYKEIINLSIIISNKNSASFKSVK